MRVTRIRAKRQRGFILLMGLMLTAGLLTFTSLGLLRSTQELNATTLSVISQQAMHLAESGVDASLREIRAHDWDPSWTTHAYDMDLHQWIRRDPAPDLTVAGASIDAASGDYVLGLPDGSMDVRITAGPDARSFYVHSVGQNTPGTGLFAVDQTVCALVEPFLLSRFFFFSGERVRLDSGQYSKFDAGDGDLYVGTPKTWLNGEAHTDGFMQLHTGGTWWDKRKEFIFKNLMVYGEVYDTDGSGGIYFRTPDSTAGGTGFTDNGNYMPGSSSSTVFRSVIGPVQGDGSTNLADPAAVPNPAWTADFLTQNDTDPTKEDLSTHVKEWYTGALPVDKLAPRLEQVTIDSFVQSFKPIANKVIRSPADVPCNSAGTVAHDVDFANAKTLKVVKAIEIDLAALNDCAEFNGPKVYYIEAPVRLTEGVYIANDLTIVSPDAIYVKGDLNVEYTGSHPRSVAIVTGNRPYFLSESFRDYTQVVSSNPDVINGVWNNAGKTGTKGYNEFAATYDANTTLPPWPQWLPYFAPETRQNMMVVAPVQGNGSDRLLNLKYGIVESFHASSGYNRGYDTGIGDDDQEEFHLTGSFIQLRETLDPPGTNGCTNARGCYDYAHATYYDNPPYTDADASTPVPQDDHRSWVGPVVDYWHMFVEPNFHFTYLPSMRDTPPPGFLQIAPATGSVAYWGHGAACNTMESQAETWAN